MLTLQHLFHGMLHYFFFAFQWPVGLKNVGQTCWFSAVIQSLFYLPAFRNLVLNYQPPPPRPDDATASKQPPEAASSSSSGPANSPNLAEQERSKMISEFMCELRKLFALMLASERKYVDPSKAVELLRGGFVNGGAAPAAAAPVFGPANHPGTRQQPIVVVSDSNQQEDVSEFTHFLFDWVKEALKKPAAAAAAQGDSNKEERMEEGEEQESKASQEAKETKETKKEEGDDEDDSNPLSRLFFGRIHIGSRNQDEESYRTEEFTEHMLRVNSEVSDLHQAIDASTAEDDSSQERWFTHLPPMLIFSLARFTFNTAKSVAEKVHSRLEFPETLHMDR